MARGARAYPSGSGETASCRFLRITVPTVTLIRHLTTAVPPHR